MTAVHPVNRDKFLSATQIEWDLIPRHISCGPSTSSLLAIHATHSTADFDRLLFVFAIGSVAIPLDTNVSSNGSSTVGIHGSKSSIRQSLNDIFCCRGCPCCSETATLRASQHSHNCPLCPGFLKRYVGLTLSYIISYVQYILIGVTL